MMTIVMGAIILTTHVDCETPQESGEILKINGETQEANGETP